MQPLRDMPTLLIDSTRAVRVLWMMLALVLPLSAAAVDDVNTFRVSQAAESSYRIDIRISDITVPDVAVTAGAAYSLPGLDASRLENGLPVFTRVLPVSRGYAARTVYSELGRKTVKMEGGGLGPVGYPSGSGPISLAVESMGDRTFLSVVFRPFERTSDTSLLVVTSLTATVEILDEVEQAGAKGGAVLESASAGEGCVDCPSRIPVGVEPGSGLAVDFAAHRSVTGSVAWKIGIRDPGMYRISGGDLAVAGVPEAYRDASLIRIRTRDSSVPLTSSTAGAMATNDWIEFFGAALDSTYATQNVYWLTFEGTAASYATRNVAPMGEGTTVSSTTERVSFAPRNVFDSRYRAQEDMDNWFAMYIRSKAASNLVLETRHPVPAGDAVLSATLHGVGSVGAYNPDHQTDFYIGSNLVGSVTYDGDITTNVTFTFSSSFLSHSNTDVAIDQPVPAGAPTNTLDLFFSAYLECLELCYPRDLVGDELPLYFSGPTNAANVSVSGLIGTNVFLLDLTDPAVPVELVGYSLVSNGPGWTLTFAQSNIMQGCYGLFEEGQADEVMSIDLVRFRGLSDSTRQADYLVVAPDEFREPVYRLLKHRFKNGLSVQVASPDDVYNEFSFGVKDPVAIRQYFGYAFHHYQDPDPGYALLVGNGSQDPRNDLGDDDPDLIPVRMGWSVLNRTSIDQWFVTVNGGGNLADIKLGRIPASTVSNVEFAVSKIIDFETSPTNADWFGYVLLAADDVTSGKDYKAFTEANTVMHLTNGSFSIANIIPAYLDDYPGAGPVRGIINSEMELGLQLVNYIGHGAEDRWASHSNTLEEIWENADALSRSNTAYPIVSVFTCENGAFHDLELSLAEAIVLNEHAGSACFAPTTFAIDFNSEKIADGYYAALATNNVARLGEAVEEGFLRLWSSGGMAARELLFYTVIGDPAQTFWGGAEP